MALLTGRQWAWGRILAVIAVVSTPLAARPAHADVTADQVRHALARGVRKIQSLQNDDGSWSERYYPGGETALATLAMLQAGERPDSAAVQRALQFLSRSQNQHTYATALKLIVLAQADPQQYKTQIRAAAAWLIRAQNSDTGMWSYSLAPKTFDHSNSQFAMLGLHAAASVGVKIPRAVWQRARRTVLATQNRDGVLAYRGRGASYGSMTAANISNLLILGDSAAVSQEHTFRNGVAPNCGVYRSNRPLNNGLNWLGANFSPAENPRRGNRYNYYWLYAVERSGILSGRRYFGAHDWYREGAEYLVRTKKHDGTWGAGLVDTAFAVLFLAKGRKPLLIQKLIWSDKNEWNPDRHDVDRLVGFIDDKLGQRTAWQAVDFNAPLEQWLAAPLLYIQGHTFPKWSDRQRKKVREYVERGGTLLAEACCGRQPFRDGFEQFVAATFPDQPLRELDPDHPVYHAFFDVSGAPLFGIDVGCRTSILYSPSDLSCLWEQGDVPKLSERAYQLGTNIAAFATGRQALRDRLDVVTLPEPSADEQTIPAGDALRLGQVVYDGDWRPDASALVHFAEYLRDNAGLDVVTRYAAVRLTDEALARSPILYMTGHYPIHLSSREIEALVTHLRRGGFLFADACCGRSAFDKSFRELVGRAFPDSELERLPDDHPIFRGSPGVRIGSVGYKPLALKENPDLDKPELWGLSIDGRLALVYSPYALGCGLDGHKSYACRGLLDDDARRVAMNIVLFALTH